MTKMSDLKAKDKIVIITPDSSLYIDETYELLYAGVSGKLRNGDYCIVITTNVLLKDTTNDYVYTLVIRESDNRIFFLNNKFSDARLRPSCPNCGYDLKESNN